MKLKIYLDNDMISAKAKRDMLPEEQSALEAIDRAADAGQCELCKASAPDLAPITPGRNSAPATRGA